MNIKTKETLLISILSKYELNECKIENQAQTLKEASETNILVPPPDNSPTQVTIPDTTKNLTGTSLEDTLKEINANKLYDNEISAEVVYFVIGGIVFVVLVIATIFGGNYVCKNYYKNSHLINTKVEDVGQKNENISFDYVHPYKSSQICTSYPSK